MNQPDIILNFLSVKTNVEFYIIVWKVVAAPTCESVRLCMVHGLPCLGCTLKNVDMDNIWYTTPKREKFFQEWDFSGNPLMEITTTIFFKKNTIIMENTYNFHSFFVIVKRTCPYVSTLEVKEMLGYLCKLVRLVITNNK